MPIGNVSRDTSGRRDSYRPPWVKDKDTGAPPSWMSKRLKPVEAKAAEEEKEKEAPAAPITKTLKPTLRKQATIRDKSENGVSEVLEEKLVKPSATKLSEKTSRVNPEEKAKFTKSALKSIDKIPKLEDKLSIDKGDEKSNDKVPEKPTLKSVRTIDDKAKEKSVTIVDKRGSEKNGPIKVNSSVNDKPVNKTNSVVNDKPLNKTPNNINNKTPSKFTTTQNEKVNDKPTINSSNKEKKSLEKEIKENKPEPKSILKPVEKPLKSNEKDKPNLKPVEKDKPILKPVEKPNLKSVDKPKEDKQEKVVKVDKVEDKKAKVEKESKAEEKVQMATKPPTPLEKTPSKLPPRKPSLHKQPSKDGDGPVKKWRDPLHERVKENIDKTLANEIPKGHTLTKNESLRSLLKPTPPPMPPPLPPKMPPPPDFKKAPVDPTKLKKLESLRSRPRRRPDWTDMMKEVEEGKKLKHVVCNDRSSPVITRSSIVLNKGQFIFESEKPNSHNNLLKEINKGVRLKKVKTNDRSKPNLEGLRKFRRQMTIEEQVQKSMSQANLAASPSGTGLAAGPEVGPAPTEEEEIDEMDDIDKVRDDLQSTKQLLAIELRNKEAQERENKRLQTKIQNLEAELARERAIIKQEQHKTVIAVTDAYDERLVNSLKTEVERTKDTADSLEKKYLEAAEERDMAITEVEELKRLNAELSKSLQQALQKNSEEMSYSEEPLSFYQKRQLEFEKQCRFLNIDVNSDEAHNLRKSAAKNNIAYAYTNNYDDQGILPMNAGSRRSSHAIKQLSITKDDSFEEEEDSEPEEEETEEKKQKRLEKEIRNTRNKILHYKQKQEYMKRERMGFKMALKNQQAALKEEKKKYKELKREVDKMAAMMKEVGSDDEDEDEEEEESDESKKSESEEETETETEQDTESETESESEPEDAPLPKKKENLAKRMKRHETRVNALKKGNALLMANVDRLKDDVLKQRDESAALKKELDSLIDDLE